MARKRIVITGLGVASCFGSDPNVFYENLLNGVSGVKKIDTFPCEHLSTQIAAPVGNLSPERYIDKKRLRRIDPFLAHALVAGKSALEFAGFPNADVEGVVDRSRCGVLIGSGLGGLTTYTLGVTSCQSHENKRVSPFFIPYTLTNMAGAMLGIDLGWTGPNYSISTACATATYAIIEAAHWIHRGAADMMLCGGVEAAVTEVGIAGFAACKALSQRNDDPAGASRPWTRSRDGFVMGEGAGVLVLEELEHALRRGATIYAEYLGGGVSCDAHHITELKEDGSGLIMCMENALRDAGVSVSEIDHVNAHATSTPQGDIVELRALHKLFPDPTQVTANATKSMIGHALGGAGGLEAVATVMACHKGEIHRTLNFENDPEPEITLHIPTKRYKREIRKALKNSFGFGGHNASLVLGAWNE